MTQKLTHYVICASRYVNIEYARPNRARAARSTGSCWLSKYSTFVNGRGDARLEFFRNSCRQARPEMRKSA